MVSIVTTLSWILLTFLGGKENVQKIVIMNPKGSLSTVERVMYK